MLTEKVGNTFSSFLVLVEINNSKTQAIIFDPMKRCFREFGIETVRREADNPSGLVGVKNEVYEERARKIRGRRSRVMRSGRFQEISLGYFASTQASFSFASTLAEMEYIT